MKAYIFLILWCITLDALTKYLADINLREAISIIPNLLSLQYIENTGIAFSIAITGIFLKILTVILIFIIFWYYWTQEKIKQSAILNVSYSLIFAGAIGNAWERIFKWYVIDFISLEHFSVFNLADSYITLWAIGILYYYSKHKS